MSNYEKLRSEYFKVPEFLKEYKKLNRVRDIKKKRLKLLQKNNNAYSSPNNTSEKEYLKLTKSKHLKNIKDSL